ncbi:MAG: hypothetical protein M0Q24_01435 [Sulfurimonas sp.]|uniref:hypothetical protein n=1 Tax=Sulfurimonas sp. TaxID=2022749 RepID=UPI0025D20AE9|nr:hypothetical protein [Sulfurimonas sp.]MCK9490725.1 hypothetical protein [Sulfurimonas sp.]
MSKIEELLLLSENDSEAFDNLVYSIADTIEEDNSALADKPYINKSELVAGYKVYYGYRLANEKAKGNGIVTHAEVAIFNIFNFLGVVVIGNSKILEEVKDTIMAKLRRQ